MEGKGKTKGVGEETFCFITERFEISVLFWMEKKQRYFKIKRNEHSNS